MLTILHDKRQTMGSVDNTYWVRIQLMVSIKVPIPGVLTREALFADGA